MNTPIDATDVVVRIFACAVTSFILGSLKYIYACAIDITLMPVIGGRYNPFHIKPIAAMQALKGKIQCPVLIHCCKNDGVIANPDEDTIKLYEAFKNNDQTHILISDDANHERSSRQYAKIKKIFYNKYLYNTVNTAGLLKTTQPTIEELRKIINSW
jgi:hypothetical protein